MAVVQIKAVFPAEIQKVWDTVTSLTAYAWRSDLDRIEAVSDTRFIEYTKEGFATTFTVTLTEPCRRWEFDMENGNMKGHWTGVFTPKGNQTEVTFTENVTAKKLLLKPFVKPFLKKQQARYISDLKMALM